MDAGTATTVIPLTVDGEDVTPIFAEPVMLVYPAWAAWATQLPVPAPDGVKTPPDVMVPPVAVHVTALLNAPVPVTFAVQAEV
jgi:hypothetical protein